MFRQALAASEAWTPTESPWTLPTGLAPSALAPAGVAQHELVGRQRDRLADRVRREPLGQGRGDRVGRLVAAAAVDHLGQRLDPGVVRLAGAERAGPASLYWSSSFGSSVWMRDRPAAVGSRCTQNRTDWRSSVWACSLPVKSSIAQARQARTTRWTLMSSCDAVHGGG